MALTHVLAEQLFGNHFVSAEEARSLWNVSQAKTPVTFYSEEVLEQQLKKLESNGCRTGRQLFLVYLNGMSLTEIQQRTEARDDLPVRFTGWQDSLTRPPRLDAVIKRYHAGYYLLSYDMLGIYVVPNSRGKLSWYPRSAETTGVCALLDPQTLICTAAEFLITMARLRPELPLPHQLRIHEDIPTLAQMRECLWLEVRPQENLVLKTMPYEYTHGNGTCSIWAPWGYSY